MKIGEAQKIYREERQDLIDQRKALIKQRDELRKKAALEPRRIRSFSPRRLPHWSFQ